MDGWLSMYRTVYWHDSAQQDDKSRSAFHLFQQLHCVSDNRLAHDVVTWSKAISGGGGGGWIKNKTTYYSALYTAALFYTNGGSNRCVQVIVSVKNSR